MEGGYRHILSTCSFVHRAAYAVPTMRRALSCALLLPLHQPPSPASQHLCSWCSRPILEAWEVRTTPDLVLLVRSSRFRGLGSPRKVLGQSGERTGRSRKCRSEGVGRPGFEGADPPALDSPCTPACQALHLRPSPACSVKVLAGVMLGTNLEEEGNEEGDMRLWKEPENIQD